MKVFAALMLAALVVSAVFAVFLLSHEALFVVGGQFRVPSGQTLEGDLYALFAQVTVEQEAHVSGRVISLCSDVDLGEAPREKLLAWDLFGYSVRIPRLTEVRMGGE